jgi:hypothetical protein
MEAAPPSGPAALQARLFQFAILELVRQHRESFPPLWTTESWAKLLIWLALNCGCPGDRRGLEAFARSLGEGLSGRMRRVFFERDLEDLNLRLMADPGESRVLAVPLVPPLRAGTDLERLDVALERTGLAGRVLSDRSGWWLGEDMIAVPWACSRG